VARVNNLNHDFVFLYPIPNASTITDRKFDLPTFKGNAMSDNGAE
jgi:hypothetical protein